MQGFAVSIFTEQNQRIGHQQVADWLFSLAKELNIGGVSSFAGINGIGRHGRLHSARLFELTDRPITVVLAVTAEQADALFAKIKKPTPSCSTSRPLSSSVH